MSDEKVTERTDSLTNWETAALMVAAKAYNDDVRNSLAVDPAMPVDFTVRIRGMLTVKPDNSYSKAAPIPADDALARVYAAAEKIVPGIGQRIVAALKASEEAEDGTKVPAKERWAGVTKRNEELAAATIATMREVNTVTTRGSVTGAIQVERVDAITVSTAGRVFK